MAHSFQLPHAPSSIRKGATLKVLIDKEAVNCLAHNLALVYPRFDSHGFKRTALKVIKGLELLDRGRALADLLHEFLPRPYSKAVQILLSSLTKPLTDTKGLGLGVFFYLPHVCFVGKYGLSREHNGGRDPFRISMDAQYELTRRFSAEFSVRHFLIERQEETLSYLLRWTKEDCPHVRRLCSEGTRPRLPWAIRIPEFVRDPSPCIPILERLKDDPELYVRRSVANHLGDIAKDHPELALDICRRWLTRASTNRRWLIRHALRYPAKKGNPAAIRVRLLAAP